MTITALPINASSGSPSYTARQTRQAFGGLMMPGAAQLRTRSGFRPGGAPTVTATATTWTVGVFTSVIDAGVSAVQGPYLVASDANSTGSVTAADATFARRDILYIQVSDTDEDGTGLRSAAVGYLAGTPSATPTAPATPARSLLIGYIDVPHSGAGSPAYTASGLNWVAAGGIVPVSGTTEEGALAAYVGMVVARADLSPPRLEVYDGTAWQRVAPDNPLCQLRQTVTQSIASSSTTTALTFSTEDVDTHNAHSTSTNTSRFTAPITGWYKLSGGVSFAANATGRRACWWNKNGAQVSGSQVTVPAVANGTVTVVPARSMVVQLTAGTDYVELIPFQDSGSTLGTSATPGEQPTMTVEFVR